MVVCVCLFVCVCVGGLTGVEVVVVAAAAGGGEASTSGLSGDTAAAANIPPGL